MVDGIATSGLTSYVSVGAQGAVDYANGYLAIPERADEYPLTGTAVAIERMNRGEGFGGGVRPLVATGGAQIVEDGSGASAGAPGSVEPIAPDEPAPLPPGEPDPIEPQTMTLDGASQVLLFTPSVDGTEGWLVPAYAFTAGGGEGPVVMAVAGEFLQ
jgi:hypothetical protein